MESVFTQISFFPFFLQVSDTEPFNTFDPTLKHLAPGFIAAAAVAVPVKTKVTVRSAEIDFRRI